MKHVSTGGGWPAIRYAWQAARRSGGIVKFIRALRTKNACKTCALGMGGQQGGMVDESSRFPEVCKKSIQAMAADMQPAIDPAFFATRNLDELATLTPRELEHAGRLVTPLIAGAGDTHYRPISWDDALARCADTLTRTAPEEHFFYCSGRASNEAAFLLQLFARLYGTNNVNNCSYYCHQASGVGIGSAIGTGTATIDLDDLAKCDAVFLIGGNPASNHPRLMRQLMWIRRRGGDVVVINPMRETGLVDFSVPSDVRSLLLGSQIASHYIQPHIGGDIALLTGIAKCLVEQGKTDNAFIHGCTEGYEPLRDHLRATTWGAIVAGSGVERTTIEALAKTYIRSTRTVFAWTMGITHHVHGVKNVQAIVNLALLRGMIGKPGAGLLPLRGHSNVQGIGSVGVTPALKKRFFAAMENRFGVTLPTTKGLDTLACMEAAKNGQLHSAWCLGGNLFGANPDARFAQESLGSLDSMVYLSTTLNTGHVRGRAKETMILPVLPRDEEDQTTTQESMFNYVRLSDGGPRRHDGPRSEVALIADIACRVLGDDVLGGDVKGDSVLGDDVPSGDGPVRWSEMRSHRHVREAIAAIVPGYEKVARIDRTGEEFQIAGRTFHQPLFNTPTRRAKFHVVDIPPVPPEYDGPQEWLRLMTIRSEGQFNTVVYEEHDLYRHQDRRDVILLHPDDMRRLGVETGEQVTVRSVAGCMTGIHAQPFDIRAGNAAMYYPEANVLVPRTVDPKSRTPAFKHVAVSIEKENQPEESKRLSATMTGTTVR